MSQCRVFYRPQEQFFKATKVASIARKEFIVILRYERGQAALIRVSGALFGVRSQISACERIYFYYLHFIEKWIANPLLNFENTKIFTMYSLYWYISKLLRILILIKGVFKNCIFSLCYIKLINLPLSIMIHIYSYKFIT